MKNLSTTLLSVLVVVSLTISKVKAQDNSISKQANPASIKQLADAQELVFKAEYVNVRGGLGERNSTFFNKNNSDHGDNHITLKGNFTLSLKPDSVSSFLPLGDADYRNTPPFRRLYQPYC